MLDTLPRAGARLQSVLGAGAEAALRPPDAGQVADAVARFLALLELYREGNVSFDQVTPLGDLYVTWVAEPGPDEETGPSPAAGVAADAEEEYG